MVNKYLKGYRVYENKQGNEQDGQHFVPNQIELTAEAGERITDIRNENRGYYKDIGYLAGNKGQIQLNKLPDVDVDYSWHEYIGKRKDGSYFITDKILRTTKGLLGFDYIFKRYVEISEEDTLESCIDRGSEEIPTTIEPFYLGKREDDSTFLIKKILYCGEDILAFDELTKTYRSITPLS